LGEKNMAVIDESVLSILEDELERNNIIVNDLENRIKKYPKGSLICKKRSIGGNVYKSYYLVWKENNKNKYKYVKKNSVEDIDKKIKERKALERELKLYKNRISYINKFLRKN